MHLDCWLCSLLAFESVPGVLFRLLMLFLRSVELLLLSVPVVSGRRSGPQVLMVAVPMPIRNRRRKMNYRSRIDPIDVILPLAIAWLLKKEPGALIPHAW